jgi:hypothetical protein
MTQWRERVPYEWCVAVSAVIALAISPWVPSIPFSRLLSAWVSWIGEPFLGWPLVAFFDGLVATGFPIISAAILGFPLLFFCSLTLHASRPLTWIARTAVASMFLLAGMATVDAVVDVGSWFVWSQIAVGCAIGVLFLIFGFQLRKRHALSSRIRVLAIILTAAGACMATFILLPVALVLLCASYVLLVPILASRQSEAFEPTG